MPALLQAIVRLASLRRLGVFVFALAALLATTSTASARELVQTKTRVGAFELSHPTRIGRLQLASLQQHRGFSRLELRLCLRPAPLWSWPGQNPFRWRDPSGRDAEEWFLRNGDALALGVAAAGLAPLTLYTAATTGVGALVLAGEAELGVAALIARLGWAASPAARLAGASLAAVAGGAKACGDAEVGINGGPAGWAEGRVAQLAEMIPAAQQGRITMAAGLARDGQGNLIRLIGTSEPNGYLRPGVSLLEGEVLAPGLGHAEADIAAFAKAQGWTLIETAATRPICPGCMNATYGAGGIPLGPLKLGP